MAVYVRKLFLRGLDTMDIAKALQMTEAEAYALLHEDP